MKPQYTRRKVEYIKTPTNTQVAPDDSISTSVNVWQCPELVIPGTLWCALCTYWLWSALPFVLALPLGCVLGIVLFFVVAQIVGSGATTTFEMCIGGSIGWVMAFLVTLTLPSAREQTRATNCLRSVKAASVALLMYADDNDGYLPPGNSWETKVRPYVPRRLSENDKNDEAEPTKFSARWPLPGPATDCHNPLPVTIGTLLPTRKQRRSFSTRR